MWNLEYTEMYLKVLNYSNLTLSVYSKFHLFLPSK